MFPVQDVTQIIAEDSSSPKSSNKSCCISISADKDLVEENSHPNPDDPVPSTSAGTNSFLAFAPVGLRQGKRNAKTVKNSLQARQNSEKF